MSEKMKNVNKANLETFASCLKTNFDTKQIQIKDTNNNIAGTITTRVQDIDGDSGTATVTHLDIIGTDHITLSAPGATGKGVTVAAPLKVQAQIDFTENLPDVDYEARMTRSGNYFWFDADGSATNGTERLHNLVIKSQNNLIGFGTTQQLNAAGIGWSSAVHKLQIGDQLADQDGANQSAISVHGLFNVSNISNAVRVHKNADVGGDVITGVDETDYLKRPLWVSAGTSSSKKNNGLLEGSPNISKTSELYFMADGSSTGVGHLFAKRLKSEELNVTTSLKADITNTTTKTNTQLRVTDSVISLQRSTDTTRNSSAISIQSSKIALTTGYTGSTPNAAVELSYGGTINIRGKQVISEAPLTIRACYGDPYYNQNILIPSSIVIGPRGWQSGSGLNVNTYGFRVIPYNEYEFEANNLAYQDTGNNVYDVKSYWCAPRSSFAPGLYTMRVHMKIGGVYDIQTSKPFMLNFNDVVNSGYIEVSVPDSITADAYTPTSYTSCLFKLLYIPYYAAEEFREGISEADSSFGCYGTSVYQDYTVTKAYIILNWLQGLFLIAQNDAAEEFCRKLLISGDYKAQISPTAFIELQPLVKFNES